MTIGLGAGTRAGVKEKIAVKNSTKFVTMSAALLELCNTTIRALFETQFATNPSIIIDESYSLNRGGSVDTYEEEADFEDLYDPPDMEANIETGEGGIEHVFIQEETENFFQYALRQIDEDFDPADDAIDISKISEILKDFKPDGFSLSDVPEDLQPWFDSLLKEFPSWRNQISNALEPSADIIFQKMGREIHYDINLGILDRIRINKPSGIINPMNLSIIKYDFSPALMHSLIQARRNGLCLLARFLMEKQAAFLQADDLCSAIERLRSIRQFDFLEYANQRETKPALGFNENKGESWATRVVKNKWIKTPFSEDLFPAKFFFNEYIEPINVLRKAIEIQVIKNNKTPLKAPEQCAILRALCGQKTQSQTIRKTLWPLLQKFYPEQEWQGHGIAGVPGRPSTKNQIDDSDLAELINLINNELKLSCTQFSEGDVKSIREEIHFMEKEKK